ncbi:MAG: hypothetical protein ACYDHC_05955 [Desulfuromonadaceae bacterium]
MDIKSGWVKPPTQIGGLDHLAVQAPCINLYGRYLPGITNVTDRARYYSFYPWLVWALEKAGHTNNESFIDEFRKADCLFTLIAHHHSHSTGTSHDSHAAAVIGSNNLSHQISEVNAGKTVKLSEFTHRIPGEHKYFKNKLGGLGQYYLGVFAELNIMDGSSGAGVKYTNQIGKVLAESMDKHVDRNLFIATLKEDYVSPERLDELKAFCPCQLNLSKEEHSLLCDLFFVKGLFVDDDMLPRRKSLQTILHLADELATSEIGIDLENFRGCTYCGYLPSGKSWDLPERLKQNRDHWSVYQRNELLSVAIQGLFFTILDAYQESGHKFDSVDELCQWFLTTPEIASVDKVIKLDVKVGDSISGCCSWVPDYSDWTHENHEVQLAAAVTELCHQEKSEKNRSKIILSSVKILVALLFRAETHQGYGDISFMGNYFQFYPINLRSFIHHSAQSWNDMTVKEWISWLCKHWGLNTHLRVALRKLRGQSQSTFRIRPSDRGLEVTTVPPAVFTSPRFYQSLRILKDIGALVEKDTYWTTSALGSDLKELTNE